MPVAIIPHDEDDRSSDLSCESMSYAYDNDNEGSSSPISLSAKYREAADFSAELKIQREREGRCADCGLQTYKMQIDPLTGQFVKLPLSLKGEVHRGRCLLCYPVFPANLFPQQRQQQDLSNSQYPVATSIDISDNGTFRSNPSSSIQFPERGLVSKGRRISKLSGEGCAKSMSQKDNKDIIDILATMKRASRDLEVQKRGCECLWILSWDDENASAIGRVGGISIILGALQYFTAEKRVCQPATEALQNLAARSAYNQAEICDAGGVSLIVSAMMRHLDCAEIQLCGCTLISSLASSSTGGSGKHRKELNCNNCVQRRRCIAAAGGFHAVLVAGNYYSDRSETVLRSAHDALYALGYEPAGRLPAIKVATAQKRAPNSSSSFATIPNDDKADKRSRSA